MQRLDALGYTQSELAAADIPPEVLQFIPPRLPNEDNINTPHFPSPLGEELVAFIQSKPSPGELSAFMEEKMPSSEYNTARRTELLIHAALFMGKPSLTHTRAALEKLAPALVGIAENVDEDEERLVSLAAVRSAVQFWKGSLPWAAFSIGSLVDSNIAAISTLLSWLADSTKGDDSSAELLPAFWRRRCMEDLLARATSAEARAQATEIALATETDDAMDLWLSRRR